MTTTIEGKFSGKVVLVTGGSRGIGAEIVREFAKQGASVAFSYSASAQKAQELEEKIQHAGGVALAIKADAADSKDAAVLIQSVVDKFGKIDILVNNAGVFGVGAIGTESEESFDKIFDINVKGVWAVTNEAAKHISEGGRIINIGSVVGEKALGPGLGVYTASKFAVQGLTRAWSKDLASRKITVNNVQPGPIDTDMNPNSAANPGAEGMINSTSLKRYGKVEEIAPTVLFLASEHASYITGASITIDGGILA